MKTYLNIAIVVLLLPIIIPSVVVLAAVEITTQAFEAIFNPG